MHCIKFNMASCSKTKCSKYQ